METHDMGKWLRELRKNKGWTQTHVAKAVGTTKGNISKIENKPKTSVNLAVFFALADLYKVDPRELATGKRAKGKDSLPQHRMDLIEAYGRLPGDVRRPIRILIESLEAKATADPDRWARKSKRRALRAVPNSD